MTSNEEKLLKEISQKLDALYKLVLASAIFQRSQQDQILFLSLAGLKPKDIAKIIGTTPNTVRVRLTRMRSKKKKK